MTRYVIEVSYDNGPFRWVTAPVPWSHALLLASRIWAKHRPHRNAQRAHCYRVVEYVTVAP